MIDGRRRLGQQACVLLAGGKRVKGRWSNKSCRTILSAIVRSFLDDIRCRNRSLWTVLDLSLSKARSLTVDDLSSLLGPNLASKAVGRPRPSLSTLRAPSSSLDKLHSCFALRRTNPSGPRHKGDFNGLILLSGSPLT